MDKYIHEELIRIGANIRHIRRLKDLKQKDLAKMAGITNASLSKIENGLSLHISYYRLCRIAITLEIEFTDFMGNTHSVTP